MNGKVVSNQYIKTYVYNDLIGQRSELSQSLSENNFSCARE